MEDKIKMLTKVQIKKFGDIRTTERAYDVLQKTKPKDITLNGGEILETLLKAGWSVREFVEYEDKKVFGVTVQTKEKRKVALFDPETEEVYDIPDPDAIFKIEWRFSEYKRAWSPAAKYVRGDDFDKSLPHTWVVTKLLGVDDVPTGLVTLPELGPYAQREVLDPYAYQVEYIQPLVCTPEEVEPLLQQWVAEVVNELRK